jgi:hypothetical protein
MTGTIRNWRGMGAACLLGLVVGICGCKTTQDRGAAVVEVTLTGSDQFEGGGRTAKLADLPALLKKNGAGSATQVIVVVPDQTPAGAIAAISGKLTSSGYRKIIFRKPRHAASSVGSDKPAGK